MEKSFVFFAALTIGCVPLALMGMVSEMAMFGLIALAIAAAAGMVLMHPSERKR